MNPLEQKREQVEHTAERSAENAEACATQHKHGPDTDSSGSGQVDDEGHRAVQWRSPEEDSEDQGVPGHCIRAEVANVYSKEQTVVEAEVPLWSPSNQARTTESGRRERTRGPVGAAGAVGGTGVAGRGCRKQRRWKQI